MSNLNLDTDTILEKLQLITRDETHWEKWTLEEKQKLLNIYLLISKKEHHIFDLIYRYHGCDSWEDIFRDYNEAQLNDKTLGVEIALTEIAARIESNVPNPLLET